MTVTVTQVISSISLREENRFVKNQVNTDTIERVHAGGVGLTLHFMSGQMIEIKEGWPEWSKLTGNPGPFEE